MTTDHDGEFRIGAINADGSNRASSIKDKFSLGRDLGFRFEKMKVDILTVSEMSPVGALQQMREHCDKDIEFTYHGNAANKIVQVWDKEKFSFNRIDAVDVSRYYIGVPLMQRNDEKNMLHVSVHLPNKSGRKVAMDTVKRYIYDASVSNKFDSIHLHGDFNISSSEVSSSFPGMHAAIPVRCVTTAAGRNIDNIVVPGSWGVNKYDIYKSHQPYTHFPITATVSSHGDSAHGDSADSPNSLVGRSVTRREVGAPADEQIPCFFVKGKFVKVCDEKNLSVWYLNPSHKKTKLPVARKLLAPRSKVYSTSA
jgi:hypothetical protein